MAVLGHVLGADRHFDVVGHDEMDGMVLGWDANGNEIVGRHRKHHHHGHHKHAGGLQLNRPDWRADELAPGVVVPGEGLIPLPMTPQQNGGTFTATVVSITWQGQLQVPFRSERLLVSSSRVGPSSVGRLLGQMFVGVSLQQADITGLDMELVGAANAFGTRMTMIQAPPGILIRIPVVLSTPLTSTDTIFASFQFLGRVVH